jgi:16S rRNA (cytosine1402-N4)-methyltransferase
MQRFLHLNKVFRVNGIIADLGVSSYQFNKGERGFSTRFDGPLDMRMDKRQSLTAADILLTYKEEELKNIFEQYGEVTNSKTIAGHIVKHRAQAVLKTINDFKALLKTVVKGNPNKYYAQVFQALRMEVNDEMGSLKEMLQQVPEVLEAGGRIVVITFHSIEDRMVKIFFKQGSFDEPQQHPFATVAKEKIFQVITRKPLQPTEEEIKNNSRSRSAKLRVAEKC